MYHRDDENQLGIEEFFMPFGGRLSRKNRWVKMAEIMPWSLIEEVYAQNMCQDNGRGAIPARVAYGAIFVKEHEDLTDEETVTAIAENPYIQYFLGLKEFTDQPLFDTSMMVHFRKRFSVEDLAKINEAICTGNVPEKIRSVDRNDDDDDRNDPPSQAGKPNKNTSKDKLRRTAENSLWMQRQRRRTSNTRRKS